MNGLRKYGIYKQWNFIQLQRRMKFCHSQVMDGEHHPKWLARLRRPKIVCSTSYADYRPKTNAVILLDMGYTLRGECKWEEWGNRRQPKT
jgi:hypothetical protein